MTILNKLSRKKNNSYIQNEYKKIFGKKSPFTDPTTFQVVKMFFLGERLKLIYKRIGGKNVRREYSK